MRGRLVSLRVGVPAEHGVEGAQSPMDRPWRTAFFKDEVPGAVFLGKTNLAGDGQADLRHHGGIDKAVCVYPLSRYLYWEQRLGRELSPGAFGENFTVSDLDEDQVCIGDVFAVGGAVVEVSQPRSPCWKLARRWRVRELSSWFQQTGFTGWYFRVLREGNVERGDELQLLERPTPDWTVMRANRVRHDPKRSLDAARDLAACSALGESWRQKLAKAANGTLELDESARLIGTNDDA